MPTAPHLIVAEGDGIVVVTLNRPEKLNALSRELMTQFEEAVVRFRDTPLLKVMLIRASGRYFCAGADLREADSSPLPTTGSGFREMHRLRLNGMQRIYDEMEHVEKPFVVAHQGMCVGGGLELSLSCDFRLASKSAGYAFPEGKMGLLPASNGISRLTRVLGTHWARYLIMGNFAIDADRALMIGLVHEVWPDDDFDARVMAFCRHLAGNNAEQMGTAKLAIELARDVGLDQARQVERMANSALMLMPGFRELQQRHVSSIGSKDGD
jgi:enoyl-CoA hydratase/carnithine racemase